MYEIMVETHIDAAHALRGYKGKCETMHGHRFRIIARVSSSVLNEIGIACDFADIKKYLEETIADLDHATLNDIPPFDTINPSSENLASTIYGRMASRLSGTGLNLTAIEVWESPFTAVTYTPDYPQ